MFTANSPVRRMLITVSLSSPDRRGWIPSTTMGGSCENTLKKLIGAALFAARRGTRRNQRNRSRADKIGQQTVAAICFEFGEIEFHIRLISLDQVYNIKGNCLQN
jgi:hypothetical protein